MSEVSRREQLCSPAGDHSIRSDKEQTVTERKGRVEGKVAIVTGAGSTPGPGIGTGKASAVVLAREGARVLLADLHPERAEETRQMILDDGGTAEVFAGDMTRSVDAEAMVKAAVDTFGTLDILVNNIGLASLGTVVDTTEEAWDRALDVNLRTTFLSSKHAVPVMAAKGSGSIVNISSISAVRGDGTVAYSAAKGAIIAMTVDMAYSHGRQGIRVNAIAPGHITTPMVHSVSAPGPRADFMDQMRSEAGLLGTPGNGWDVGWAAAFLASDEARWITGALLPVESGVLSVTPLMMALYLRAVPEP
jgi:NAD(P)-dependent dehydrogenase (short-subunit alcohol dehydrogenase family)